METRRRKSRIAGVDYRLPDDDGGHLIASQFLGSGELDDLVPINFFEKK
ncbi:hypothetical protein GNF85_11300 [Clostridium perfringens]